MFENHIMKNENENKKQMKNEQSRKMVGSFGWAESGYIYASSFFLAARIQVLQKWYAESLGA